MLQALPLHRIWGGGGYVGIAGALAKIKEPGLSATSTNLNLLAGYEINDYLAIEGEGSIVIAEDATTITFGTTTVPVDVGASYYGVFAKISAPLDGKFSPHLRIGFVEAKVSAGQGNVLVSVKDSSVAYGLGGDYVVSEKLTLRFDYTMADFDGTKANIFSVGTITRF